MSISCGRHTYAHEPVVRFETSGHNLRIGAFCSIADFVEFFLGGDHTTDWVTTFPFGHLETEVFPFEAPFHSVGKGDIVIGNDVWIGSKATIMSGVTIGDGAVIAARAVVTRDVEPYTMVAGVPARPVKKRFSDEQIEKLLANPWWELSDDKIRVLVPFLCSKDIDALIEQIEILRPL